MLDHGTIAAKDVELLTLVDDPAEAVAIMVEHKVDDGTPPPLGRTNTLG